MLDLWLGMFQSYVGDVNLDIPEIGEVNLDVLRGMRIRLRLFKVMLGK